MNTFSMEEDNIEGKNIKATHKKQKYLLGPGSFPFVFSNLNSAQISATYNSKPTSENFYISVE